MSQHIRLAADPVDRVFKLWEIPMNRPAIVGAALRHLDQAALRESVGRNYTPQALRALLGAAVEAGQIRMALAEVPTKGVRRFVDIETLPDEFAAYLKSVPQDGGQSRVDATERTTGEDDATGRDLWSGLIGYVARRKSLFHLAERLCFRPEHHVALVRRTRFVPDQVHEEICAFLRLVSSAQPRRVLEIGTSKGGTLYLLTRFAHPAASLACVDLRIADAGLLRSFARRRQQVTPIEGDSGAAATIDAVRTLIGGELDLLFIDGDHSYEGVKQDFRTYGPMVRSGGLIVFHDIVEDNEARYGVITGGWAGGVPRFWKEVKPHYAHVEFVKDPHQDGYGIGVLFKRQAEIR